MRTTGTIAALLACVALAGCATQGQSRPAARTVTLTTYHQTTVVKVQQVGVLKTTAPGTPPAPPDALSNFEYLQLGAYAQSHQCISLGQQTALLQNETVLCEDEAAAGDLSSDQCAPQDNSAACLDPLLAAAAYQTSSLPAAVAAVGAVLAQRKFSGACLLYLQPGASYLADAAVLHRQVDAARRDLPAGGGKLSAAIAAYTATANGMLTALADRPQSPVYCNHVL